MENENKKPDASSEVEKMRTLPIESVKPYVILLTPVFVFMKLNNKLVKVKSELDFFTDADLKRLKPMGQVYLPQEDPALKTYLTVARQVREALSWDPATSAVQELKERIEGNELRARGGVPLEPASFELSDSIIRLIGPLWNEDQQIDPYYVTVFTNELCDALPGAELKAWRDLSIVEFEKALLLSSWTVFLALHLGHTDLAFIERLRVKIMRETMTNAVQPFRLSELEELRKAAMRSLSAMGPELEAKPGSMISVRLLMGNGYVSEKFSHRMTRVGGLARV